MRNWDKAGTLKPASIEKSEEQELVEDLVQIITVFSCKLQGNKANKAKKMIRELMENDPCKEGQTDT